MVGGIVIGITRSRGEAHVHVADCPHYPSHGRGDECPRPDTCCVYTDERRVEDGAAVEIQVGDSFWWQAGKCYWTPKERAGKPIREINGRLIGCGTEYDIALKKIGYSH